MGIKKTIDEPDDLEYQLNELEKKLERLRVMYEQHFLGIDKRPPTTLQHDVVRIVREIGNFQIRKTALKFRYLSLTQRFNVHRAYWLRTLREIEEGTYRRDRSRALRREAARSGEAVDAGELAQRALLMELKGEDAVEARRERTVQGGEPIREPYVPAVARKRKRPKGSAVEIRGAPAESLVERREELEAAHVRVEAALQPVRQNGGVPGTPGRSPFLADVPRPEDSGLGEGPASTPVPTSPFRLQPSAADLAMPPPTPPSGSPFRVPAPPRPFGPSTTASRAASPAAPTPDSAARPAGPSLGAPPPGRPSAPTAVGDRPAPTPGPAAPGRSGPPVGPSLGRSAAPTPTKPVPAEQSAAVVRQAARILEHAGLPEERARQIYRDLVAARARFGKSADTLTYERVLESMARQVPKLRETHGAERVDFDVVTKDDKVFLKPKAG